MTGLFRRFLHPETPGERYADGGGGKEHNTPPTPAASRGPASTAHWAVSARPRAPRHGGPQRGRGPPRAPALAGPLRARRARLLVARTSRPDSHRLIGPLALTSRRRSRLTLAGVSLRRVASPRRASRRPTGSIGPARLAAASLLAHGRLRDRGARPHATLVPGTSVSPDRAALARRAEGAPPTPASRPSRLPDRPPDARPGDVRPRREMGRRPLPRMPRASGPRL